MALCSSPNDKQEEEIDIPLVSLAMIGLPLLGGLAFANPLQFVRASELSNPQYTALVIALWISQRTYLYSLAATGVALIALRGAGDPLPLGQRGIAVTEELVGRPDLESLNSSRDTDSLDTEAAAISKPPQTRVTQALAESGIQESLDDVSAESQALLLPLIVSVLLAVSVVALPIWTSSSNLLSPVDGTTSDTVTSIIETLSNYLPLISQLWNTGVLVLFARAEVRRLANELVPTSPSQLESSANIVSILEWTIAIAITGLAAVPAATGVLGNVPAWPAQNFVNLALAIAVGRAIQLDRLPAVLVALGLLTCYDAASVWLVPAAQAAITATTTAVAASSQSAMESVAMQKITASTFQPGLLTVQLNGRLSGALGLGDIVFPSLLATLCRRFDLQQEQQQVESPRILLTAVALGGYFLGCAACEVAPIMPASRGLPALVFIIPVMTGAVLAAAAAQGTLDDFVRMNEQDKESG